MRSFTKSSRRLRLQFCASARFIRPVRRSSSFGPLTVFSRCSYAAMNCRPAIMSRWRRFSCSAPDSSRPIETMRPVSIAFMMTFGAFVSRRRRRTLMMGCEVSVASSSLVVARPASIILSSALPSSTAVSSVRLTFSSYAIEANWVSSSARRTTAGIRLKRCFSSVPLAASRRRRNAATRRCPATVTKR